jgi:nucleoid-associated protein YgaU
MTRETKLGLLVGLAFIIAFGILISNYISSTNQPPAAALRVAGDNLRSGLGQPGSDDVAPVLRVPQAIEPQQTVVTADELNHRPAPPVRFVPPAPSGQAITPAANNLVNNNNNDTIQRLRGAAQQQGEDVVPVNTTTPVVTNTPEVEPPAAEAAQTKSNTRSYEAQPGDSLGAIALKAYGSSCRANREAIVAANPSLAENRDLIVAGRTYIIPALSSSTKTALSQATAAKASSASGLTYVVKPHDTLWSIAMNEVGNAGAVAAIEDLNREVLNGSDRVRPNMKLTLPSKKTAE